MKIAVSGASGFIGQHVIHRSLQLGLKVVAISRKKRDLKSIKAPNLAILEADLADVKPADMEGCEVLIHLAAVGVKIDSNDWAKCFMINVTKSLNLWENAVKARVRRLIVAGSCFEYGRSAERYKRIPVSASLEPTGAYHSSKAAASMAFLGFAVDNRIEAAILRPFHVYGEGEAKERFWPSLRNAAIKGEDFQMTEGLQVRDFTPVEFVAREFVRAAVEMPLCSGFPVIKNIGLGKPQTLRHFARFWWRKWKAAGKLQIGAIPYRRDEVMRYVPDLD